MRPSASIVLVWFEDGIGEGGKGEREEGKGEDEQVPKGTAMEISVCTSTLPREGTVVGLLA